MKSHSIVLIILMSLLTYSCADDLTDIGTGIQPSEDKITLGTDTFHLTSDSYFVENMYLNSDSFLLGSFYDQKYGTTRADILAQVNCPEGTTFPAGSKADSAKIVLYYRSWFGDSYSPIDVNIYEMNKKTFSYTERYPTNLDPSEYSDRTVKLGQRIFTAKDASHKRKDSTSVTFKLSDEFKLRFFNSSFYTSSSVFTAFFGGMYITANYGASTMLNISNIDLLVYAHFTTNNGKDTTKMVIPFPANDEVRQVNRFEHPDRNTVVKMRDSVNYVSSPANIYTHVNIPLKRMSDKINAKVPGKKMSMNSALLRIDATEVDLTALAQPIVGYMLLIKESAVHDFFAKNKLPSDTCALLGSFTATQVKSTSVYEYFYTFNLASLVSNELKIAAQKNESPVDRMKMVLIPVRVKFDSKKNIVQVDQQFLLSAITIRSGKNAKNPMKIDMVYSGF